MIVFVGLFVGFVAVRAGLGDVRRLRPSNDPVNDRVDVRDPEAGFSLTEVLAALIILSTAIIAIIGAFGTSIIAFPT